MTYSLEDNSCTICGEDRPEMFKIWFDGYVKLYKCCTCSFVARFPGPGNFTVETNYHYSSDFLSKGQEFMRPERHIALDEIIDRITKIESGNKILDIGCGDGHFLYRLSKRGFDCYGIENDKKLASYVAQKANADIVQGVYEYNKNRFPAGYFDIISFIHVLEHMPTPTSILETAHYHLKNNGLLIIEVPSLYAPHFLAYQLTRIKWFVKPPNGVIYSHYGYYNPKTIAKLTNRSNFEELSVVTGRWQSRYNGIKGRLCKILDPMLNFFRIGRILYIGIKR